MGRPDLGLYVHIPFCRSKCAYCDFYSLPRAEAQMDRYTAALARHLRSWAPAGAAYRVTTVYFGGGTPSYLGTARLTALLSTVQESYRVAGDAEITVEANPDSLGTVAELRALAAAGCNRLSLGVQSADDSLLRLLGRPHTFSQAVQAVERARTAGFENLSLDLIYGLPGQSMDGWQQTVEQAAALGPEHLSCYGLKLEEGTPLWKNREAYVFPDDDLQADMYLWAVSRLAALGYQQYEISNFAKPGRESRHNLKYWTLQPYVGFGPGAHSDFGGVRWDCPRDFDAYCAGALRGCVPVGQRQTISQQERAAEYLMLGLRTAKGVAADGLKAYGMPFSPVAAVLERFRNAGYTELVGGRWRLTPEGFLVSNPIIGDVLDALVLR